MNTDLITNREISIPSEDGLLHALLTIPEEPKGLIVLAYGNGGNETNHKNIVITEIFNLNGFATCLIDLLMEHEDISFLKKLKPDYIAERLIITTEWLIGCNETNGLDIGYYGESTCASETIYAASKMGISVKAIVSRGCNQDGLLDLLGKVSAPVLALADDGENNRRNPESKLYTAMEIRNNNINRNSSVLFEERRKLTLVAKISLGWFDKHLNGNHQNNEHKWF